eukprot:TRINITY_DN2362_c0_g1_i1.p1 TRINITY_DN2362_c0_g1~~TRINITY_DN2362_c0_g1_i1.p1  ORF type:complete len:193 (+),score=40.23 TRINITY_DN2362_c0_g1_i1:55-633(+)
MGFDRTGLAKAKAKRSNPASRNPYIHLLVKLYRFLSRRTGSQFNQVILKRLCMSQVNRPHCSVSRILKNVGASKPADKTIVVVGTVTDDTRVSSIPALKVAALRFTEKARARILSHGGQCITLDQLAVAAPRGRGCLLVRGKKNARETCRHWGAAGVPGDHAKPYVGKANLRGRGPERARGRRASRAFKVKK